MGKGLRVKKPPSGREVARRAGGREPRLCPKPSCLREALSPTACGRSPLPEGAKEFFDNLGLPPLGEGGRRPDEGMPCRKFRFVGLYGKLAPHQPALRAASPQGKPFSTAAPRIPYTGNAGRCCLYCVMVIRPPWRAVLGVNCPAAHKAAGFQRVLHIGVVGVGIGAYRQALL